MTEILNSKRVEAIMEQEANAQGINESQFVTKNNICKRFMHSTCDSQNCRYSHDLSKAIPCRNFIQSGYCAKGNLCNYLHQSQTENPSQKPGSIVCKSFRETNYCPDQNNCPYKHSKIICRNYEKGFCVKGGECNELHQAQTPCRNYLFGFCPNGPNCLFAHPKMLYNFDFNFLKSWNKDVNISKCNKCQQYGHKDINCKKEVIFGDLTKFQQ